MKALRHGSALKAIRDVAAKAGRELQDYALHSLCIGGTTALAAGGGISEIVIQGEDRWKSDAHKLHVRHNVDDSRRVSRKQIDGSKTEKRQLGGETVWGRKGKRPRGPQ